LIHVIPNLIHVIPNFVHVILNLIQDRFVQLYPRQVSAIVFRYQPGGSDISPDVDMSGS